MKNTAKLTLAELKVKAAKTNVVENLDAIKGGELSGCHTDWDRICKAFDRWAKK
jgi:hypothetical protein